MARESSRTLGGARRLDNRLAIEPRGARGTGRAMAVRCADEGAALLLACADGDDVVAQCLNVDGGNWLS